MATKYEYTVVFTYNTDIYGVLIETADSPKEAIKQAIEKVDKERRNYNKIEVIFNI
jgi:hypothetical protein